MAERSRTQRFARQVTRHRVPVALALLLVTAFFAYPVVNAACAALGHPLPGPRVRIGGDPADLLPDHPFLRAQRAFAESFGGASIVALVVQVDEGTVFRPEVLSAIHGITAELDGAGLPQDAPPYPVDHDRVRSLTHPSTRVLTTLPDGAVEQRLAVSRLPTTAAEAEALRRSLRARPPAGYARLVSADERAALVSAAFVTDRMASREVQVGIFSHLRGIAARWEGRVPGLRVLASGAPVERGWVLEHSSEILAFLAASLVAVLGLLWLWFRRWHGVAIPAIAAGTTAIWGLGFAGWMGIAFDPLVLVIPMLISARAVSHTVQMAERFFEDYADALPRLGNARLARDEAAASAMGALLVPGTLGVVTDVAGLLAILVTTVPQMRDLALFGAFWVGAIAITVEVLHPVLISLLPPPRAREQGPPRLARAFARRMGALATHPVGRWAVAGSSLVLLGICTAIAVDRSTVGHTGAGSPLFWSKHPFNVATAEVSRSFGGVDALVVYAEGDRPHACTDAGPVRAMTDLERVMARETPLGASASLAPLVRGLWRANHFGDPKWEYVPRDTGTVRALIFQLRQDGPPGALRPFLSDDGRRAQVSLYYPDHRRATVDAAVDAARDFVRAHPLGRVALRLERDRAAPEAPWNDRERWLDRLHYFVGPMLPPRHHTLSVEAFDAEVSLPPVRSAAGDGLPDWIESFRAEAEAGFGWHVEEVGQWWESPELGVRAVQVREEHLLVADARAAPDDRAPRLRPTGTWTRGVELVLAGGSLGVLAAVNEEVGRSHVANLSLIFAAIFLLHSLTYRSLASGAILLLQLGVATSLALAALALRGVGLDLHTLPVQSVGVGIGVDYAIYIVDRIRQEAAAGGDVDAAIRRAVERTGAAVCITATTLILGVALWVFSGLRYQAEMAGLLVVLMALNMLGALLVVPAFMAILRPGLRRR